MNAYRSICELYKRMTATIKVKSSLSGTGLEARSHACDTNPIHGPTLTPGLDEEKSHQPAYPLQNGRPFRGEARQFLRCLCSMTVFHLAQPSQNCWFFKAKNTA